MPDAEVVFTTESLHMLDLLFGSWQTRLAGQRTLVCSNGEYDPNLAVIAAHRFDHRPLPTLADGKLALDDATFALAATSCR